MNQKVVTLLPLSELWNEAGTAQAAWHRDLCSTDIRTLLSNGDVRFVVADIGKVLRWIPMSETFRF